VRLAGSDHRTNKRREVPNVLSEERSLVSLHLREQLPIGQLDELRTLFHANNVMAALA